MSEEFWRTASIFGMGVMVGFCCGAGCLFLEYEQRIGELTKNLRPMFKD